MSTLRFRNSQAVLVDIPTIVATEVKNKSGDLLDRMQTRKVKKAINAAFNASPAKLGRAARQAAHKVR
jgi:hypothetical protein